MRNRRDLPHRACLSFVHRGSRVYAIVNIANVGYNMTACNVLSDMSVRFRKQAGMRSDALLQDSIEAELVRLSSDSFNIGYQACLKE